MAFETLVIGDLHSHPTRLEELLKQERLIEMDQDGEYQRIRRLEVEVVLLGDVGHFGGAPRADIATWELADRVADVILWGNHDRAVISRAHQFSGYQADPSFLHTLDPMWCRMLEEGRLKLAHAVGDFLLTHAGVAYDLNRFRVPFEVQKDPQKFADWINEASDERNEITQAQRDLRDAVSTKRGGQSPVGGILWRDIEESLYDGFRQIFGHSADHKRHAVRRVGKSVHTRDEDASIDQYPSYCIDVGGRSEFGADHCLAGIYLPSEITVRVDLDA